MSDAQQVAGEWVGTALTLVLDSQARLMLALVRQGSLDAETAWREGHRMLSLLEGWSAYFPGTPHPIPEITAIRQLTELHLGASKSVGD